MPMSNVTSFSTSKPSCIKIYDREGRLLLEEVSLIAINLQDGLLVGVGKVIDSVLRNLITFAQGKQEMRIYDSADDFIEIYPFIPYQFKLLQEVFNGIRTHGASGKHLSEGERSLLNAFQEAAVQYADAEDGALIPFNAFYKTVETFLDHNILKVMSDAKDSAARGAALTAYDVEVLKVLFMIKYIAEKFAPNLENITTIMLTAIDQDKLEAKRQITDSLRRLEEQRFIIRNGDVFLFLTNEEQDINREITDIRVDSSTLVDEAGKLIFSTLFGLDRKFRYNSSHDFTFNTYIDDKALGNQKEEIGIRVITPYYSGNADEMAISLRSGKESNVLVVLPANADFVEELKQSMQIAEFMNRSRGKVFTDTAETIVATKRREGTQRMERCKDLIIEALKRADIYVNGNKLSIKEKAPKERVNDAFADLVEIIYSKLNYVKEPFLTVKALEDIFKPKPVQATIDGSDKDPNHLALEDLFDVIAKSSGLNLTHTVRSISDRFGKAPYAWKEYDIAGIMLTLFKEQKIRLELSGENVATHDTNVINYCTKRDFADRVVVKIRDNNNCSYPFLEQLYKDYDCKQIVFEMKNVAEVSSDHINQLNRYLSGQFGRFGVIVARNGVKKSVFRNTIDLWSGQRKSIICLDDEDMKQMVDVFESKQREPIEIVKKKFIEFIRACPS